MGISVTELMVILAIIVLLFGTKKLRSLGSDLGEAIKGFRKAMSEPNEATPAESASKPSGQSTGRVIEGEVTSRGEHPSD